MSTPQESYVLYLEIIGWNSPSIKTQKTLVGIHMNFFWSNDNWLDRIIGNIIYPPVVVGKILITHNSLHIHFLRFTHENCTENKTKRKVKILFWFL